MKRVFDFVGATVAFVVLSPLMLAIALAIRLQLGRDVLFRQRRPGLHGKPFMLVKFRSMTDERGADGELLADQHRLTRFGRFLRRSSLDELPELFNVIRGDLSIVGPRPLLLEYLPLYSAEQMRRHDVKPGLTGWAQVHGRNAISWSEKLKLDVWYVDHRTLWLDLKILFMTLRQVLSGHGVNQEGHATVERFKGNAST